MGAAIARADETAADLPREVWAKGKRPIRGVVLRVMFAISLLLAGLITPLFAVRIAFIVIGVGSFFLVPPLVDAYLDRLAHKLGAASKSAATGLINGLEDRRLVALFAPHAWISLQKGKLHMILRDGRAAAVNFAEAARQLGNVEQPQLLAAQAQGYVMSGDRKLARELLVKLEERDLLRPWDRVNLAIVYVEEPGKTKRALEHLLEAKDVLGEHARVQAALALAHARNGDVEEAARWAGVAEDNEELDEDARDLVKRARKDLRGLDDKRGRSKPAKKKEAPASSAEAAPVAAKKGKRGKKDRRKERREKRKGKPDEASESKADAKKRIAAEKDAKRVEAEKYAAETKRIEAEKKAAAEAKRIAAEKQAEDAKRIAAEKQAEDAKRTAEAKRVAAEKQAEAEKQAAEAKRVEAEKKAAEKPVPPAIDFAADGMPVFRAPAVPPPPAVKQPDADKPPAPTAPTSDGWDDLLGDD